MLRTCAENGTRVECECYGTAHLYNLAHVLDRKLVTPPLFVQTVFGILGGIGIHPEDVMRLKRIADRLFGDRYRWSLPGACAGQMRIAAQAARMGCSVRVDLEDGRGDGPGKLAEINAAQVRRVRACGEAPRWRRSATVPAVTARRAGPPSAAACRSRRPSAPSTRATSRRTPKPASAAGPRPPSDAPCVRASTARAGTSTRPSPYNHCTAVTDGDDAALGVARHPGEDRAMTTIAVNGTPHSVGAGPTTPLLYWLRNDLALNAAKHGCGLGQCGAFTVIVEGEAVCPAWFRSGHWTASA